MEEHSSLDHDELSEYEIYGKTPPRTKILRKNKDRKHREKYMGSTMSSPKVIKSKNVLSRRNTVSTMYDELFAKADQPDVEHTGYNKRSNKRHMKLLRGSERDLKLDIASAQAVSNAKTNGHNDVPKTPQPSYQVESCKRFMSLSCRTVQCLRPNNKKLDLVCDDKIRAEECPPCRVEFYQTLSLLIRMGGGIDKPTQERHPRRYLSREETLWQNELKDVIWLELQAFHADRTPIEEDIYLCGSREGVDLLLKAIMNYRFESPKSLSEHCEGCLSISCSHCLESQNRALLDIEDLMARLEDAEALFPSSKAFAELYPMYNSPDFVGRVKAIILWYNMTKHNRFKLIFLDRLFNLLQTRQCQWPLLCDDSSDSPSDSNNSNNSSMYDYSINCKCSDLHVNSSMLINKKDDNVVSPYRRYIENLLKTRALHKSLMFLDKLHQFVLQKSQVTLEKPASDEIFSKSACDSDEEELQRYGCWSPEAKALNLPSYRAGFLFLATVPLEVIYEYLQMRLEQKPQNPSPLSVRQLMRELKGGLHIASTERSRILKYFQSAVEGTELKTDKVMEKLEEFDKCMLKVFEDYLDYLEQWALLHHDTFQKNLLEEEFQFSINLVTNLPGGDELLANKFGHILSCILKRIGERLLIRIEDVLVSIPKEDDNGLKQALFSMCRELQALFNEEREMSLKTMSFCKTLFKCAFLSWKCKIVIRDSIISFKCLIPKVIARVQNLFDLIDFRKIDELDKTALNARIREILMQVYRFGFEFYKEVTEGAPLTARPKLVSGMVQFANLWMQFVTERCERGRGMRPRWAYQGLEFLLTVCEPCNTKHLSENEFEELKRNMDICISHVIGTIAPSTPDSGFMSASPRTSLEHIRAKSRGSSPSPRPTYKSQRSNISTNSTNSSRKTSMEQNSPIAENLDESFNGFIKQEKCVVKIKLPPKSHSEQVRDAIEVLESELDQKLRSQNLIGKAMSFSTENKMHFRRRNVTFSWQRGIKIGQGRFGKVYTAVNNNTGEMMAVKEVALQHNDNLSIKRVAEEIKILEGVIDQNLVRSYGVEVHKDEMLIFMEFCAEGTLESLVAATEAGLPELLVRRYTYQLVSGVGVLHDHGIVHRDIKTANIFLTEGGNSLKIGDFGCAAKIKSNSTMPGELKGFVGTQAYMAPEVFTKNMAEGYGRAADIWSVGCVVVEMASGKRPWAEFDSNYQIMFKVGMGQSPDPPDDMIDEGLDFLEMCFKHNPKERATAGELSNHNFVKVGDDLI